MSLPTPLWFVEGIQKEINSFLWNNKPPRIKFTTAISDYNYGGLRLTDFNSYVIAHKAAWIKRLLNNKSVSSKYIREYLPKMDLIDLANCNIDPESLSHDIPFFYRQILFAWYSVKHLLYEKITDVRDETLWFNKNITIENKTIFYEHWYNSGIKCINDLLKSDNSFMSFTEFCNINDVKCNFLEYSSIIHAIPNQWKYAIKNQEVCEKRMSFDVNRIKGTSVYWKIIESKQENPTCVKSWFDKYSLQYSKDEWKCIFKLPWTLTQDSLNCK